MPKKQLSITIKKFKKELQQLGDIELACLFKRGKSFSSDNLLNDSADKVASHPSSRTKKSVRFFSPKL